MLNNTGRNLYTYIKRARLLSMEQYSDFTRYSQLPKTDENPYLWAQSQEVSDAKNTIEQIKLSYLTTLQNIQHAENKLFGAVGSEENPSPLSVWYGYKQIPETAAWQLERKIISNPNELDLARTVKAVTAINTYRRLIQEAINLIDTFPKNLEQINKFFPEETKKIQSILENTTEKLSHLRSREQHFKELIADIKTGLASGAYSAKLAEPIGVLLKQIDAPISDITVKVPHINQEMSFENVRQALLPAANDNASARNERPPENLAA